MTKTEEAFVSKYVNEYIDGLRMDVVVYDGTRVITLQPNSRIVVVDKDFLMDNSKEYSVFLRHPIEDYFYIPKEIDYYETQFDLSFDRKDGFQIKDITDAGVIDYETITLEDARVNDNCLHNLVIRMCFDVGYQKLCPEVKDTIDEFFSTLGSPESELLKNRIGPFLGVQSF